MELQAVRRSGAGTAILVLVLVALLAVAGCGGSDPSAGATTTAVGGPTTVSTVAGGPQKTFSLEQLAEFDGKNGAPAYVAVDGLVYDVTGSRMWPEGEHARCDFGAMAGQDLSETIKQAPANMRALLGRMPVVGVLGQ